MKKRLMAIGFFLVSILTFGKVNDNLNLFNENQKIEIEKKVEDISEKRNISVYINSFSEDEGFVAEKAEKLVILNLIKTDDDRLKIELKLTKDIELDEVQDAVNELLNTNEQYLQEKQFDKYAVEILSGLDDILAEIKIKEPIVIEEEVVEKKESKFFIIMGVVFFIIFALIIRILMVKYKKSFKEEMEIVSRKK
ncbi:hypothetical protein [Fusobacterium sp. HC1336]|jgi:ABC-type Na+ efflux pump permease subunit|uniref:hypothetical protein n=1 Tax=Fusobacterium sp. HC1336 TaxID=3171169 RepID=UPI003F2745EE